MKSPRARGGSGSFVIHSVDRLGRTIDPAVLAVAHDIGPRAVAYAERLLADTALVMNLFEESAGAVSEALKRRPKGSSPVRDLSAYLYRTFLRKVSLVRDKRTRLEKSLHNKAETQSRIRQPLQAEISLLFNEVMASYDEVTRQIISRRLEGFSWKEIATEFGIETHAAETRYSRALAQARLLLRVRRPKG